VGKGYLIDSNIVIGYLDNKLPSHGMKLMNPIIDDIPNISIITKIEVLRFNTSLTDYGILTEFVSECAIINLNDLVVDKTIAICKTNRIKLPDAIIAATALVHELILVTRNTDDFKKIKKLKLLNPWGQFVTQDRL
jgi:predicted nucleic acid-binding protein